MLRKLAPGVEHSLELTPRLGGWCYLEASLGLDGGEAVESQRVPRRPGWTNMSAEAGEGPRPTAPYLQVLLCL